MTTEKSNDRDGDGRQSFGQNEEHHPPMTDEQFDLACEHLKNLPVVRDHHLELITIRENGLRILLLKEPSGRIIRRIPENELWTLQAMKDQSKGQILSKSA